MANVIARVRLAKGRVGYFDELTRIHLTVSKPEAPVFAGMNTANIKRAVRSGVLRLVAGTLDLDTAKVKKDMHAAAEQAVLKAGVVDIPAAPAKTVEAPAEEVVETPAVEAVETPAEPTVEAPVEEEKKETPKKAARRKKPAAEESAEQTEEQSE